MKISELSAIIISLILLLSGCGTREKVAENPSDIIDLLRINSGKEEIISLYTDETVKEFNRFIDLSGMSRKDSYSVLSFIPERSEVVITEEKCEKDTCILYIKFISHPVENMKGFSSEILLKKGESSWKIDRSSDFRKMRQGIENNEAGLYLERI